MGCFTCHFGLLYLSFRVALLVVSGCFTCCFTCCSTCCFTCRFTCRFGLIGLPFRASYVRWQHTFSENAGGVMPYCPQSATKSGPEGPKSHIKQEKKLPYSLNRGYGNFSSNINILLIAFLFSFVMATSHRIHPLCYLLVLPYTRENISTTIEQTNSYSILWAHNPHFTPPVHTTGRWISIPACAQ